MTIREKRQYLADFIYSEQIALGNVDSGLKYMTDSEVELYFENLHAFFVIFSLSLKSQDSR